MFGSSLTRGSSLKLKARSKAGRDFIRSYQDITFGYFPLPRISGRSFAMRSINGIIAMSAKEKSPFTRKSADAKDCSQRPKHKIIFSTPDRSSSSENPPDDTLSQRLRRSLGYASDNFPTLFIGKTAHGLAA